MQVMEADRVAVATCVWCGASLGEGSRRLTGRTLCAACGAATTDPWPSGEELADAYGTWYRPEEGPRFWLLGDALLRRTRGALARRLDRIAPPGAILDVGAGDGVLLDALRRRGREARGLERDSRRPDIGDQRLQDVTGRWAAVVFWHSLEHLPDPGEAIRRSRELLEPGGVVVIAVPNSDSLQARAFGDRWLALDLPRHLVHLSEPALVARLQSCGFAIERVSQIRGGQIAFGWLDGLVGRLPGGLDLYQALRRAEARRVRLSSLQRAASVGAGVVLLPVAVACAVVEVALGRSGTVYVEARLAR